VIKAAAHNRHSWRAETGNTGTNVKERAARCADAARGYDREHKTKPHRKETNGKRWRAKDPRHRIERNNAKRPADSSAGRSSG